MKSLKTSQLYTCNEIYKGREHLELQDAMYPYYIMFTTPFRTNKKILWVEVILKHLLNKPWVLKSGKGWSNGSCCFFFSLFKGLGFYLQQNNVCVLVHWPWIRVVSKGNLCQIPALWNSRCAILFFLRHWHRVKDAIPQLLLELYFFFCSTAWKYCNSDTLSVVVALYSSKLTWNETITEFKVLTLSFKGISGH